uniref:Transposase n=2 Tax=Liquorilactobacillus mali TaxID=1618 RepID=A0A0A7RFY4_9LACO|nr:transposase [Liquorilactobacillus mali KCTC 3596 = DSM 20444]
MRTQKGSSVAVGLIPWQKRIWQPQEQVPAYRTICRFRVSDEVENLINQCIQKLTKYLKQNNFIDEVTFIDGTKILADAGYGSESNYRYFEDELPEHTALIPYGTMLKENSRKWQSDDRKVMNWTYHPKDDYFIDPQGVRFSFYAYRKRKDKYGFVREFKEYKANKYDNDFQVDHRAFTKNGNPRKISVNDAWEYFKAKERKLLSNYQTGSIYGRRKIDVESIFGGLKACLGFKRFSVRGLEKVKKEAGIALMARVTNYSCFINKKKRLVKIKEQFSLISSFLKDLWHSSNGKISAMLIISRWYLKLNDLHHTP